MLRRSVTTGLVWHDFWIAFFVIIIAVGMFIGHGLVIAFGVMGTVAGVLSLVWSRLALSDVTYERALPEQKVFLGEEVSLTVSLSNKKPLPLPWLKVNDEFPDEIEVVAGDIQGNVRRNLMTLNHQTSIAWYERIRWEYRLRCSERGLYQIGPARVESGDPFGFLRTRATADQQDFLLVYPRVHPIEELGIPAYHPLGEVHGGLQIFPDPSRPAGIREYQVGDPLKTIDWKSTARNSSLHVRTYEPSTAYTVILITAVDTVDPFWGPYERDDLERVVTAAASIAVYATEKRYRLGLFSNDMPSSADRPMTIPPGNGRDQLGAILGALAVIRPYAIGPMADHLSKNYRRLPFGATLVVVASFLPPGLVDLLGMLRDQGFRLVLVYAGKGTCPPVRRGILVHEVRDYLDRLEAAYEALPR